MKKSRKKKIDRLYTKAEQQLIADKLRVDYIDNNMQLKDLLIKYNMTDSLFSDFRSRFNLYKPDNLKRDSWEKSMRDKYGVTCSFQSSEINKKREETMLKKYGTTHALQVNEFKNKAVSTMNSRYGVDYAMQSSEIVEKLKQNNLNRTGYISNLVDPEFREYSKKVCQQRYGEDYYLASEDFKEQMKSKREELNLKQRLYWIKLNYDAREDCKYSFEQISEIVQNSESFYEYFYSLSNEERNFPFMMNDLCVNRETLKCLIRSSGISYSELSYSFRSRYEEEVADFLSELDIDYLSNNPYLFDHYIPDFYIPKYNLVIEVDGNFYHQDIYHDQYYHQNKFKYFYSRGIRFYAISQVDWMNEIKQEIIKSQLRCLLGASKRVFARRCEVRQVCSSDVQSFLASNHLQGPIGSSVYLGLYLDNKLVEIMSFGHPRFSTDFQYELHRLCTAKNMVVVGGASKLFSHFVKIRNPQSIVTYADLSSGSGNVYEKLGFQLVKKYTSPSYMWINLKTGEIRSRYQTQIPNENEAMTNLGFIKMWGYGSSKFVWSKKQDGAVSQLVKKNKNRKESFV